MSVVYTPFDSILNPSKPGGQLCSDAPDENPVAVGVHVRLPSVLLAGPD